MNARRHETGLLPARALTRGGLTAVAWRVSSAPVPYPEAVAAMEARVAAIARGEAAELVWLLEHPPIYTAGTSATPDELLAPTRFPVFQTGRGGRFTYHGPGQRVVYVMLDVKARGGDVRAFVAALEQWVVATLAAFDVVGEVRPGRIGVWVARTEGRQTVEEKIAAIGIRIRQGISYHGLSLNVAPDLSHFSGIVPCGIADHGVTSLRALGRVADGAAVDAALAHAFEQVMGPIAMERGPLLSPPPS